MAQAPDQITYRLDTTEVLAALDEVWEHLTTAHRLLGNLAAIQGMRLSDGDGEAA
jgi:hypothetical protein